MTDAPEPQDPGELFRRRLEADPYVAAADAELEQKIAELVDDQGAQWDLLGYILTEYKPAILDAGLAAWTGTPAGERERERASEPAVPEAPAPREEPARRDDER